MIVQNIIVGLIVSAAAGSVIYRFVRSLTHPASKCDGCASSACGGCAIRGLKEKKI
ncbi:MAG: FeoB-associated Cys-rich membrane protein [Alphaproteobacteria bacterium]|nr:FeoB-associated Cys-rich membrane protein [Alphaproteobacteria bacterium]